MCAIILPTGLISWWVVMVGWRCSRTWLAQSDWPLNGLLTYRWADEFLTLQGLSLLGAGVMLQSVKCTLIIYFHINCTEQWYEVIICMFQESDPVSFIVKWGFFLTKPVSKCSENWDNALEVHSMQEMVNNVKTYCC